MVKPGPSWSIAAGFRPVDGIKALEVDSLDPPSRVHPYREILRRIRVVERDPVAWPEYRGLFAGEG